MDLDAIDRTCKPCDDFYEFTVGKWNAENPIPATQTRWANRWAGAGDKTLTTSWQRFKVSC